MPVLVPCAVAHDGIALDGNLLIGCTDAFHRSAEEIDDERSLAEIFHLLRADLYVPESSRRCAKRFVPPISMDGDAELDERGAVLL